MRIGPDKWKHFWVGAIIALILHILAVNLLFLSPMVGVVVAFLGVAAIGYGWELLSLLSGWGHYDLKDAVATSIGSLPGVAIGYVFTIL